MTVINPDNKRIQRKWDDVDFVVIGAVDKIPSIDTSLVGGMATWAGELDDTCTLLFATA